MPVGRQFLLVASLTLASFASAIAVVGLLHEILSAHGADMLIHSLEEWMVAVGYHIALILLAAAGVSYLANKK